MVLCKPVTNAYLCEQATYLVLAKGCDTPKGLAEIAGHEKTEHEIARHDKCHMQML